MSSLNSENLSSTLDKILSFQISHFPRVNWHSKTKLSYDNDNQNFSSYQK